MLTIAPLTPDTPGFERLLDQSQRQGHRMVQRFAENWHAGRNRFDRPGETMLGASQNAALVGLCGRNIDPYDPAPRAGRVRHLYVDGAMRRSGIGRLLIDAILTNASTWFDYLNTNAPIEAFPFYEALGFKRLVGADFATHRLTL